MEENSYFRGIIKDAVYDLTHKGNAIVFYEEQVEEIKSILKDKEIKVKFDGAFFRLSVERRKKMIEIKGEKIARIEISNYVNNNNLALTFICKDEIPYATITVNFDEPLQENMAYIDTNNCSWVEDVINEYELGEFTNNYKVSGFCVYPIYEINLDNIKDYNELNKNI